MSQNVVCLLVQLLVNATLDLDAVLLNLVTKLVDQLSFDIVQLVLEFTFRLFVAVFDNVLKISDFSHPLVVTTAASSTFISD